MKILELFGGIGACSKALERLGIDCDIADYVEIDKYAVNSFNAIHGANFEPQDIRQWDKDIKVDLIMHGSPCQDFSIAGKQAGGDEGSGTRSSLMYETLRIVEKLKPKYVIWENVKNLLSKKHRHNFDAYIEAMSNLGYVSKYQVLNAKDYGVPQNRERVFTVSCRHDGDSQIMGSFLSQFEFPEKQPLTKRLKDVLEKEVDEKFYLTDSQMKTYQRSFGSKGKELTGDVSQTLTASMGTGGANTPHFDTVKVLGRLDIKGHDQIKRVYDKEGLSPTLSTMQGGNRQPKIIEDFYKNRKPRVYESVAPTLRSERTGLKVEEPLCIKTANKKGYDEAIEGDGIDLAYPDSNTRRGRVGHGVSKTIMTGDSMGVVENYRIRKLTPKECWRLMGFNDKDFEKAARVNSNAQLYKQAGNSIVVNVLEAILGNLLKNERG